MPGCAWHRTRVMSLDIPNLLFRNLNQTSKRLSCFSPTDMNFCFKSVVHYILGCPNCETYVWIWFIVVLNDFPVKPSKLTSKRWVSKFGRGWSTLWNVILRINARSQCDHIWEATCPMRHIQTEGALSSRTTTRISSVRSWTHTHSHTCDTKLIDAYIETNLPDWNSCVLSQRSLECL